MLFSNGCIAGRRVVRQFEITCLKHSPWRRLNVRPTLGSRRVLAVIGDTDRDDLPRGNPHHLHGVADRVFRALLAFGSCGWAGI
jgi:hypothetical protein